MGRLPQKLKAKGYVGLVAGFVSCALVNTAGAAGFALNEHSVRTMGHAMAGSAAFADDAGIVFFNPAGMTELTTQAAAVAHGIFPNFDVDATATQVGVGALSGSGDNGGTAAFIPNSFFVYKYSDRVSLGFGVNTPFGLETSYDNNWAGRFHALRSKIVTVNFNPSIAYKLSDQFSVGVGVNAQYMEATLTNAINFGIAEGAVENRGDDVSFGFNAGVLAKLSENTRIGVSYRSGINHSLEGEAKFDVPAAVASIPFSAINPRVPTELAALPTSRFFQRDSITAQVNLPAMASMSVYHRISGSKFAVMADATWTEWSSVPELRIVFDDPLTTLGPGVEELNWKNTWRFSGGMDYHHSDAVTLRAGGLFDESPIPDNTMRTPRLPGSDRLWLSLGGSYEMSSQLSFDVAYYYLLARESSVNRVNSTGAVLTGSVDADAHILSAQVNYHF